MGRPRRLVNEKVEYVIRGVEYVINLKFFKSAVRNGVRNDCRKPKLMVDGRYRDREKLNVRVQKSVNISSIFGPMHMI